MNIDSTPSFKALNETQARMQSFLDTQDDLSMIIQPPQTRTKAMTTAFASSLSSATSTHRDTVHRSLASSIRPNFPSTSSGQEPLFFIPPMPILTKVPEPRSIKKPPMTGYDMRTLRKQVEFLNTEIEERVEVQTLLYQQNEELWDYTQALLESNKTNTELMRHHVRSLQEQLREAHKERYSIAEKLQMMQNSRELMRKINSELSDTQVSTAEARRLRSEAERELQRAREENAALEESLHEQVQALQKVHLSLDDYRHKQRELEGFDVADEFWYSNQAVLRSAYKRFREGVKRRFRLSTIQRVMSNIYKYHLRKYSWKLWMAYLNRRRFMHNSDASRDLARLHWCMSTWKVYTTMEKLFYRTRRTQLLKKTFFAWSRITREAIWEDNADCVIHEFKLRRRKRLIFTNWKSQVTFLAWSSQEVLLKERFAIRYFASKVLREWRRTAYASRQQYAYLAHVVLKTVRPRKMFKFWKVTCQFTWRRRGLLIKKFFKNVQHMVARRVSSQYIWSRALTSWITIRKNMSLKKWIRFTRRSTKHHSGRSTKSKMRIWSLRNRRSLRIALIEFARRGADVQSQKMLKKIAKRHFAKMHATRCFHVLYRKVCEKRRADKWRSMFILKKTFGAWKTFVPQNRKEMRQQRMVDLKYEAVERNKKKKCIKRWIILHRRMKTLRKRERLLAKHFSCVLARKTFSTMRCRWSRNLYWRLKEATIDAQKLQSLQELSRKEIEDLEYEKRRLTKITTELEDSLVALQEALAEKENVVREQVRSLEVRKAEKESIEKNLSLTQRELQSMQEERHRLKSIEEIILVDRQRQHALQQSRKEEAEKIMKSLQEDAASLAQEEATAREQAYMSSLVAADELEKEKILFEQSLNTSEAVLSIVRQRENLVETLEQEQRELEDELIRVQSRLTEVTRQGNEMLEESDAAVRNKAAEVRVLTANAGLTEARLVELRALLDEKRSSAGKMHLDEVSDDHDREYRALVAMTAQVQEGGLMHSQLPPALSSSSSSAQSYSTYSRTSSPYSSPLHIRTSSNSSLGRVDYLTVADPLPSVTPLGLSSPSAMIQEINRRDKESIASNRDGSGVKTEVHTGWQSGLEILKRNPSGSGDFGKSSTVKGMSQMGDSGSKLEQASGPMPGIRMGIRPHKSRMSELEDRSSPKRGASPHFGIIRDRVSLKASYETVLHGSDKDESQTELETDDCIEEGKKMRQFVVSRPDFIASDDDDDDTDITNHQRSVEDSGFRRISRQESLAQSTSGKLRSSSSSRSGGPVRSSSASRSNPHRANSPHVARLSASHVLSKASDGGAFYLTKDTSTGTGSGSHLRARVSKTNLTSMSNPYLESSPEYQQRRQVKSSARDFTDRVYRRPGNDGR